MRREGGGCWQFGLGLELLLRSLGGLRVGLRAVGFCHSQCLLDLGLAVPCSWLLPDLGGGSLALAIGGGPISRGIRAFLRTYPVQWSFSTDRWGDEEARRFVPRIALTPPEAAAAIGVGPDFFDANVAPELRLIRRGRKRLIPVSELERWAAENAEQAL